MTSDKLAISVIVPLYNKAETVIRSIASVQAQTFNAWELVVIDDGSTDAGPEQVAALDDERIRLVKQANGGVSAARNRGIAEARCELLAFLDADDTWLPGYLAAIVALAAAFPEARWFATSYLVQHPFKGCYQARLGGGPSGFEYGILSDYFSVAVQSDPPVWSSATVVKREAILSIGGFPADLSDGEDLITWAKLACQYPLAYDTRALAVYDFSAVPRPPDPEHHVTQTLLQMLKAHRDCDGLRAYIGLWNRMQAVKAMRFDNMALARRCAWRAFFYGPWQWRNGYTLLLALLPGGLRRRLDNFLRKLVG